MPERRPLKPRAFARPNGTEQIVVPGYAAQQRLDALAPPSQAGTPTVAAAELLAQISNFDCWHVLLQTRVEGTRRRRTSVVFS